MKLLVIEDNHRLRKTLVDVLRDEGYATDSAADGGEGLYKALNWDYDLIVLDVMMPEKDGFEVLAELRDAGHATPVLMLSARGGLKDRLRGLDSGADDFLVKPFEMDELISRIRSALRRSRGTPNPVLTVGPITLNTATRSVCMNREVIELTAREYALFEILATRHNEVVTRDEIYEKLFDERDETVSNMLDVYIYKLRQKLGKEHVLTRRGMGYQMTGGENSDK